MAIAGRVAIVPKGEYSNAVTYDKLDLVMFNNDAYVAKKASTGIEPTNDEYWMLILNNVVADDLEKIIDGTTPVGNANKLGGKLPSEYIAKDSGGIVSNGTEIPLGVNNPNGWNSLFRYSNTAGGGLIGFQGSTPIVANADFSVINAIATTADLANYMPKSSANSLFQTSTDPIGIAHRVINANRDVEHYLYQDGTYNLVDNTNGTYIFQSTKGGENTFNGKALGNLPLSGGLVATSNQTPIIVQNTTEGSNSTFIKYRGQYNDMGCLGFANANIPAWIKNDGMAWYELFHTGNKPTGSYTGNGSATSRTISTGGLGNCVMIFRGANAFSLLSQAGYIAFDEKTVSGGTDAYFSGGNIYISSTSALFNTSGVTYGYQVL